ncbi:hypothetical protein EJ08DRAFT_694094 [Tothia fuscella]|uniref:Uncharacterized protein n=1 Tax=Tothia fuscella TaxID=1048955 RepID=A0A9P4NZN8_9PEZI|nr:hypothetical protein EJ08DRAFT_694094 [Tothia fuscella]
MSNLLRQMFSSRVNRENENSGSSRQVPTSRSTRSSAESSRQGPLSIEAFDVLIAICNYEKELNRQPIPVGAVRIPVRSKFNQASHLLGKIAKLEREASAQGESSSAEFKLVEAGRLLDRLDELKSEARHALEHAQYVHSLGSASSMRAQARARSCARSTRLESHRHFQPPRELPNGDIVWLLNEPMDLSSGDFDLEIAGEGDMDGYFTMDVRPRSSSHRSRHHNSQSRSSRQGTSAPVSASSAPVSSGPSRASSRSPPPSYSTAALVPSQAPPAYTRTVRFASPLVTVTEATDDEN